MLPQFSLSCNSGSSGCSTRHKSPKREILLNLLVVIFSTNGKFLPCYPFRFPWGSVRKESTCNEGDVGLIPGLGRSPGGGHGNRLQYSGLANPHGQGSMMGCNRGVSWDPVSSLLLLLSRTSRAPSALLDTAWLKYEVFNSVQSLSRVQLFVTPCTAAY